MAKTGDGKKWVPVPAHVRRDGTKVPAHVRSTPNPPKK